MTVLRCTWNDAPEPGSKRTHRLVALVTPRNTGTRLTGRHSNPLRSAYTALALAACAALAACQTRTNVSATANVPAQYAHVWVTIQAVWFNSTAAAGPDDTGWQKFTLPATQSIDLVGLTGGVLSQFAQALKVPAGSYNQVRLLLVDPTATLTASAQTAGALFNDEVDYYDASGVLQQAQLQVPDSAQGIAVPVSLVVKALTGALGTIGTSTATATPTTTTTVSTTATATTSTPTILSSAVVFDAERDLVPVALSGATAYLLNPHLTGYDLSQAGNIAGTVSVGALAVLPGSSRPDVEVSAETLSTDGTRHVILASAPVSSSGSFVLYPLSMPSGSSTQYDLVIHGGGVGTVIVQSVPVTSGAPTGSDTVQLGAITLAAANTYAVTAGSGTTLAPAGASVGFYQTLPGSSQVPYLIESRPIDPFAGNFFANPALSAAEISYGAYSAGMSLATAIPAQGSGTYSVALSASLYGDGALTSSVAPPGAPSTSAASLSPAALALPTAASAAAVASTITVTTPRKYNRGELVLTHDGSIIAVAALDAYLASSQSSPTLFAAVPGGSATSSYASGLYYAEVWVWNSTDVAGTFSRQPVAAAVDLRSSSSASVSVTID